MSVVSYEGDPTHTYKKLKKDRIINAIVRMLKEEQTVFINARFVNVKII